MSVQIIVADYQHAAHGEAIRQLMQQYALDPMGGGEALPDEVLQQLVPAMAARDYLFSLLAMQGPHAVGLANCVLGFSTFRCAPLLNIHDLVVSAGHRGQGIGKQLLAAAEQQARQRGCCKVTLEVLAGNESAQRTYRHAGFAPYQLRPETGIAQFWQKQL